MEGDTISVDASKTPHGALSALRACAIAASWAKGALFLHGAGLASHHRSLLLVAESGGGKSTLVDIADQLVPLSDENVVLFPSTGALAGTPFRSSSKRRAEPSHSAPLSAICFLRKGARVNLEVAPRDMALRELLAQVYRPSPSHASASDILRRASKAVSIVPCYSFEFPKSKDAAAPLYELVGGEQDSGAA